MGMIKLLKEYIEIFEEEIPFSERFACSLLLCELLFIVLPLNIGVGAILYGLLWGFGYLHLCLWSNNFIFGADYACGLGWSNIIFGYPISGLAALIVWGLIIVFVLFTVIAITVIGCLCIFVPFYLFINILKLKEKIPVIDKGDQILTFFG